MVRAWVYSIIGGIILLAALRSMIAGARADYYRLPRKQRARGAVLPVETISPPEGLVGRAPPRSPRPRSRPGRCRESRAPR